VDVGRRQAAAEAADLEDRVVLEQVGEPGARDRALDRADQVDDAPPRGVAERGRRRERDRELDQLVERALERDRVLDREAAEVVDHRVDRRRAAAGADDDRIGGLRHAQRRGVELEVGRRVPLVLDRRELGQVGQLPPRALEVDREPDVVGEQQVDGALLDVGSRPRLRLLAVPRRDRHDARMSEARTRFHRPPPTLSRPIAPRSPHPFVRRSGPAGVPGQTRSGRRRAASTAALPRATTSPCRSAWR
jgi:hypothetical protein